MGFFSLINRIPLFLLFWLTLIYSLLAIGMRLGKMEGKRSIDRESIGTVVGASLALLAFLLAFTFNMAASRFDDRKKLFIDEVNSIETTYLRSGLLTQPYKSQVRALLCEYVDLRVRLSRQQISTSEAQAAAEDVQTKLWDLAIVMLEGKTASISHALFINSLNETIDLQTKRVTVGVQYRIPETIWVALYAMTGFGMVMLGYQFGQPHKRHIQLNALLAIAFTYVVILIVDLDRASEGTVRVSDKAIYELQNRIQSCS